MTQPNSLVFCIVVRTEGNCRVAQASGLLAYKQDACATRILTNLRNYTYGLIWLAMVCGRPAQRPDQSDNNDRIAALMACPADTLSDHHPSKPQTNAPDAIANNTNRRIGKTPNDRWSSCKL
jgi:hypothetical protein